MKDNHPAVELPNMFLDYFYFYKTKHFKTILRKKNNKNIQTHRNKDTFRTQLIYNFVQWNFWKKI